jgi:omega-6 fatty acid desaturase (delta-12 desaturase)
VGFGSTLLVELLVMVFASIAGVWLFSVQHRFEDAAWMRQDDWSAIQASVHGSSYLELPRLLQWFTGNIGFHHVHHLVPRVPNYRLEECDAALADQAGSVRRLSFRQALQAPSFALWDEAAARMTPFPQ